MAPEHIWRYWGQVKLFLKPIVATTFKNRHFESKIGYFQGKVGHFHGFVPKYGVDMSTYVPAPLHSVLDLVWFFSQFLKKIDLWWNKTKEAFSLEMTRKFEKWTEIFNLISWLMFSNWVTYPHDLQVVARIFLSNDLKNGIMPSNGLNMTLSRQDWLQNYLHITCIRTVMNFKRLTLAKIWISLTHNLRMNCHEWLPHNLQILELCMPLHLTYTWIGHEVQMTST